MGADMVIVGSILWTLTQWMCQCLKGTLCAPYGLYASLLQAWIQPMSAVCYAGANITIIGWWSTCLHGTTRSLYRQGH